MVFFLSFADEETLALVADDEVDAAIVLYLNMSCRQGRPVGDGEVLLAGLLVFQPQYYGKLGGQKTRSVVQSSEGLEKKGSDTIKTTLTKNDLAWSLLGDDEKQKTSDGLPCLDDGCDVLLLQSMREDLIRPMHGVASDWSLLLHPVQRGVPSKSDLPLDHQSGCWPSLREDLRVPIRRFHQQVSESNTGTGTEGYRSVSVSPFWSVAGQCGRTPHNAGDQKNGEGGNQTTALPGTKNLEDRRRFSPISTKANSPTSKPQALLSRSLSLGGTESRTFYDPL